ncbi:hypothetical protein [Longitalea luteola]|uniref:hypothetical protein n=1 Tax=Longitalea luteola TaxID=2812563 RepID=UPI001A95B403|nr:hypothetical protein [Longitalea luteola]
MLKKTLKITVGLFIIGNSAFAQWGGSTTINSPIWRTGGIGIGTDATYPHPGHISFGAQGTHLSIPRSGFVNQVLLETNWSGVNGDYTDLRVPGAVPNNAVLRLQANGHLGVGAAEVREKFQLGSKFFFHDGGTKKITVNSYYDANLGVVKRAEDGPISEFVFHPNGGFEFVTGPTGAANSIVNSSTYGMVITNNGNVGIGTNSPSHTLDVRGSALIQTDVDNVLTFNNGDNSWQYMEYKRSNVRQAWMGLDNANDFYLSKETQGNIVLNPLNGNILLSPSGGSVCIGTTNPGSFKLAVEGKIAARGVKVTTAVFADYVFDSTYHLRPLAHVEQYINQNKHLPGMPSAKEVEKEGGFELGEMNVKLLEKIEELTLYVIELKKENEQMKKEIKEIIKKK